MANLLLDEVTGEKVSKTELKRRQKLREKEAKKKEKEAAAPPKPTKKASAEEEEANLTPNVSKICVDCFWVRATDLCSFLAILRDSEQAHQQAARDQEAGPLPAQVPSRHRPAQVPQGL